MGTCVTFAAAGAADPPLMRSRIRLLASIAACVALLPAVAAIRAEAAAPEGPGGASDHATGAVDGGEPRLEARLLLHPDDAYETRDRAGDADGVRFGILLAPARGWHVYAPDPGESGLPTEIALAAHGGSTGALAWPSPSTFVEEGGFTTYGYDRPILITGTLVRDPTPPASGARITAEVDALVCRVRCVPAHLSLARSLDAAGAGSGGGLEPAQVRAFFAVADETRAATSGTGSPASPPSAPTPGLALVLALAFLGGVLLNAMPCVLPILAIKLFAIAGLAGSERRAVWTHALAYTAGILASMLVLAGAVLALRGAGAAVGWGFQFQEPLYVAGVAVVLVVFACNLFGVFEFGTPGGRLAQLGAEATGARRSFFEGLLAVLLATPCSAPFLGTAVGFAFASPAPATLAVFLCVGAGLAAPFLLVAALPRAARVIPRSGPWMLTLRQALGFALLGTVVWLVWILGRATDLEAVVALLAVLVAVGFVAFGVGRLQLARPRLARATGALALATLVLGTVDAVSLRDVPGDPARLAALPWDASAVDARLARGQPVFVYFTADWCLTCKVNERTVLADERVRRALETRGFAVFRADWTRRDETIRAELARHGRAGVPVYLLFDPAAPGRPTVLPELLTVDRFLRSLESTQRAAGSGEGRHARARRNGDACGRTPFGGPGIACS